MTLAVSPSYPSYLASLTNTRFCVDLTGSRGFIVCYVCGVLIIRIFFLSVFHIVILACVISKLRYRSNAPQFLISHLSFVIVQRIVKS